MPSKGILLLTIQRDSRPVFYDPTAGKVVGSLDLGAKQYKPGTPQLWFSRDGRRLWATDYDTLVLLQAPEWKIIHSFKLQNGDSQTSLKFVGNFALNRNETLCAVARPFSSDIVIINANDLSFVDRVVVGHQPLEVVLFSDGTVLARDWQTGTLLKGSLNENRN